MQHDDRGLPLSTDSTVAAASFDRAVEHYLKFHADTMAVLNEALADDPAFVMGHVFKGYLLLSASNPANASAVASSPAEADSGAAQATPREQMHVAACAGLGARRAGPIVPHLAAASRCRSDRPAGGAHRRSTTWFRHGQTAGGAGAGGPPGTGLVPGPARI